MGKCDGAAADGLACGSHEEHDLHPVLAAREGAAGRQGKYPAAWHTIANCQNYPDHHGFQYLLSW